MKQERNYWKIAFWTLVGILFLGGGIVSWKLFAPSPEHVSKEEQTEIQKAEKKEQVPIQISLTGNEVETMVNEALNTKENQKTSYDFVLQKKEALLQMKTKLLGLSVEIIAKVQPVVMENGDLKLKINELGCGELLHFPTKFLLREIKRNEILPKWIEVLPDEKAFELHFAESPFSNYGHLKVETIDLNRDVYQFTFDLNMKKMLQNS